jgi:hypothetical protein
VYEVPQIPSPWSAIPEDPMRDMALAERAVSYLETQKLDHSAVVQCLIDELDLDLETAQALAVCGRQPEGVEFAPASLVRPPRGGIRTRLSDEREQQEEIG